MSEPTSVLEGARSEGGLARIADAGPVGMVTLRGDLADGTLAGAVREAAGLDVPGVWQASLGDAGRDILWMAPDELLLLTDYAQAPALARRLDEALAGRHHLALDVSDARAVLDLSGAATAEVLAKGAPIDLSPAAFPPGAARRTHLGGIAVVFWRRSEEDWRIACFRSFGRHLYDWLVTAARPGSGVFREDGRA